MARAMRVLWVLLGSSALGCTPRGVARDAGASPPSDSGADVDAAEAGPPDSGLVKEALPPFPSDDLTSRGRHLLEAIAKDDPSLATDIVFPRDAYIEAKDVADPGKQWDDKVMGAFQKHVHALHRRTKGVEHAQFTSLELGQPISQVVPKRHDMNLTLWRVAHSKLNFTVDGKVTHAELSELMSWGGAWYVLSLR
jgi:hypothetical protein